MLTNIIPGILEKRWESIKDKLEIVYNKNIYLGPNEKIKLIQIDICDGVYVKSQTWSPAVNSLENKSLIDSMIDNGLPHWEDFEYEADLMVSDLKSQIEKVSELGFALVVLHSEDLTELIDAVAYAGECMLTVGIASRDIGVIVSYLDFIKENNNKDSQNNSIDFIQIMGIKEIGKQGEPFDESIIESIKLIKAKIDNLKNKLNRNIFIQIDGAMNEDTIKRCSGVGATHFVQGSAYFKV